MIRRLPNRPLMLLFGSFKNHQVFKKKDLEVVVLPVLTMLRQSSSRNHRSKGLKLKKALQITLLILVSVWLIYQVKHSYEKKAAYSEDEVNDLHKDDKDQGEVIKLGRKDLPPKMEADSSTLDEKVEDEENDEMEQEMKHDENDEDPIDEQDLERDDDLPEPGEHSADKDGDDVGVFEDEEHKERSQEDQEKSFHGDNVSSAVTHDPPSSEQDELSHHAQEKVLFVDDASTAVPHENQEEAGSKEEEVRKAREKSFRGDDVASSVDHDAKVTKPLPEEQLNTMDRIFEGTTNLSNGISFRGPGVNGSNATGEHVATPTNTSFHQNADMPSMDLESKTHPTQANLTSNHEQSNSTLNGQPEQPVNSTAVLHGQVQPLTDQTPSVELHSPPNGTLALVTDGQKSTSGAENDDNNTGSSSTPVDNKVEGKDARKEDVDVSTKIMNRAMSEEEVVPE
ncbi:hypothetical protein BAE44_0016312 [Dichanthelium oligosanthes]|uniref:Uncharacterized protein n=1 Tax=Dichanthelium oligosanthes TaxID=888268 RepID=A0A1E5VBZ1_9POAL|nr:hypothetical protein BAE44_0016312 [Dichanthelium oligosanthes]